MPTGASVISMGVNAWRIDLRRRLWVLPEMRRAMAADRRRSGRARLPTRRPRSGIRKSPSRISGARSNTSMKTAGDRAARRRSSSPLKPVRGYGWLSWAYRQRPAFCARQRLGLPRGRRTSQDGDLDHPHAMGSVTRPAAIPDFGVALPARPGDPLPDRVRFVRQFRSAG